MWVRGQTLAGTEVEGEAWSGVVWSNDAQDSGGHDWGYSRRKEQ